MQPDGFPEIQNGVGNGCRNSSEGKGVGDDECQAIRRRSA